MSTVSKQLIRAHIHCLERTQPPIDGAKPQSDAGKLGDAKQSDEKQSDAKQSDAKKQKAA